MRPNRRKDDTVVSHTPVSTEVPASEAVASTGLLLMFAAVIGVVMGVSLLGMGSAAGATAVIVAAMLSFAASIVCFAVDARRVEAAEAGLPFPSMLRR
ncbi:hypothetical protein GCM10023114_27100 [Mycolicibacterium sediminis]|uniref:UsfY protein n=1 Tax=Mycolicibacterium sediminis TaxID=1286180 RepID=A0A7I7QIE3_9MYCO|nr:hypothetical protein MSEDJ_01410 [Mycolicibacterium sediminis]